LLIFQQITISAQIGRKADRVGSARMFRSHCDIGRCALASHSQIYAAYYNDIRPHLALDKEAPNCRRSLTVGAIVTIPVLGGLRLL